jgi:hypothetical protein
LTSQLIRIELLVNCRAKAQNPNTAWGFINPAIQKQKNPVKFPVNYQEQGKSTLAK